MDNQQPRRFDTDEEYRDKVKEATYNEFVYLNKEQINGVNHHWFGQYPLNDRADFTTVAIIRELLDIAEVGQVLKNLGPQQQAGIADYIGETIRQGMVPGYNPYEQSAIDMSRFDLQPVEMDKPLDLFARAHVKWGLERWESVQGAFMTAEKLACRTDLTERESCHGVARDVYHQTGTRVTLDRIGQDMPVDPGQDYAHFYENQFCAQITNRAMKAAQDLFKG